MSLPYRRDIVDLRAIAVLFVFGFHYFQDVSRGGLVGVDVFFVISGLLITGLIRQDVAKGTFSIAAFYGRRIRRIFPALICVLLVAMALGYLFMLPAAYRTLGVNAAASAGFAANIALWLQQSYFAPSGDCADRPRQGFSRLVSADAGDGHRPASAALYSRREPITSAAIFQEQPFKIIDRRPRD